MERFDRNILLLLASFIIIILVIQQVVIRKNSKTEFEKKIEKIELKIDSIEKSREDIVIVIKEVDDKIEQNQNNYEKVVDSIISNPDSVNKLFIDNYLKEYIDRITVDRHN